MQWLKAIYETFGIPYPRISLIAVVILGAIVFGGAWVLVGKQVEKDHLKGPTVETPRKTGDATTSGANSPAVTGNGNEIQYNHSSPPKEKRKPPK